MSLHPTKRDMSRRDGKNSGFSSDMKSENRKDSVAVPPLFVVGVIIILGTLPGILSLIVLG